MGTDSGGTVTPGRAQKNFLQPLDSLIPPVPDTMVKTEARYKRAVDKHVQARRETLLVGDWVFVMSQENQGHKLIFETLGH